MICQKFFRALPCGRPVPLFSPFMQLVIENVQAGKAVYQEMPEIGVTECERHNAFPAGNPEHFPCIAELSYYGLFTSQAHGFADMQAH